MIIQSILEFILGALLIALAIIWYSYERRKFISQRNEEDYMTMSFTVKFILGAFILFACGVSLIYKSL